MIHYDSINQQKNKKHMKKSSYIAVVSNSIYCLTISTYQDNFTHTKITPLFSTNTKKEVISEGY